MNKPLVSVVVLTKNRPEYIPRCLDSILKQTYDNFDVLIIDSASNKETKDLLHNKYNSAHRSHRKLGN